MRKFLVLSLLLLSGCFEVGSEQSPYKVCTIREPVSGMCSAAELQCPQPLVVAQKINGVLFCRIKDAKQLVEPHPKKEVVGGKVP